MHELRCLTKGLIIFRLVLIWSIRGAFMKTVGAYEAKTHLSRLLKQIGKGERFIITRHGMAVAVLQPPERTQRNDPATVIAEIRAFREQHRLDGLTIRELIEEGRR